MQTVDFLPLYMKQLPQWVLWRLEGTKKLPYSANYNGFASSTNPKTWCSYGNAIHNLKNGNYSGIGFVFSDTDNLVFIDLDHCLVNGELSVLADNILNNFSDCYAELSQSGAGIHIIAQGTIPNAIKTAEVEIYDKGRYCAITGKAIHRAEPENKQEQITILWEWLDYKRNKSRSTIDKRTTPIELTLSTQEIIEKASNAKGGETFQALYEGDWQGLGIGDGSQSASDLAFANRLAFWTRSNREIMTDIFRNSGMYRNERKMNLAIKKAIADCHTVYRGGGGT